MYQDPRFWVAVSFVAFVIFLFKPIRKALFAALDGRIDRIRNSLEEAQSLKDEASALLSSYKRKQLDAENEAKRIVRDAEQEAASIAQKAASDLEEALNRRIELAMQKISSYEAAMLLEIRNHAVDIATNAVRQMVAENLSTDIAQKLVTKSISQVHDKMN